MRTIWIIPALCAIFAFTALAQDPAEEATEAYIAQVEDYDASGIGTSLDDVTTDLAVLDGFMPAAEAYCDLAALPRLAGRGYLLVAPGYYELDGASFCLHAGAHRPGGGDGYGLAPLKGMGADLARALLYRWLDHPDVDQDHIQALIWAIDERVGYEDLGAEAQSVAERLLTPTEIDTWATIVRRDPPVQPETLDERVMAEAQSRLAGALGIPISGGLEDVAEGLLGDVAPGGLLGGLAGGDDPVEQQLDVILQGRVDAIYDMQQSVLPMFGAETILHDELSRTLAPEGDPEPPEDSREIPLSRWSYDRAGYFIRFVPIYSYSRTLVQVSVPPECAVVRDDDGRIESVTIGERELEIGYSGDPEPIEGGGGLRSAELREVIARGPDGRDRERIDGWTLVGQPDEDADVAAENSAARLEALLQLQATLGTFGGPDTEPPLAQADALDLGSLALALTEALEWAPPEDPTEQAEPMPAAMEMIYLAFQDAVVRCDAPEAAPDQVLAPRRPHVVLAALRPPGPRVPRWVDPPRRVAQPGNTGRQRLGLAPRPHRDSTQKQNLDGTRDALSGLSSVFSVMEAATDPVGFVLGQMGLGTGLPSKMLDAMLGKLLDAAEEISNALGGDPPRADYDRTAVPPVPELPPVQSGEVSAERLAATQELLDSLLILHADLRAAQISLDRMGGAAQAGDDAWVESQALALTHHKRAAAADMVRVADALEGLAAVLEAEDAEMPELTEDDIQAARDAMTGPLSDRDTAVAEALGLPEEDILARRAVRAERLAELDPGESYLSRLRESAEALRALGEGWLTLPEVASPRAGAAEEA